MKIKFLFVSLMIGQIAFAQINNFTISGKIKGLESSNIYLIIFDDAFKNGYRRDTIAVNKESFHYKGTIDKLIYASISPNMDRVVKKISSGFFPAKSSSLQLFVFPGANIKISGRITDFVDAYPSGDIVNNDFAKLNKKIYPLLNRSVNISVKIANKLVTDHVLIKKMKDTAAMLDKQVISIKEKFVRENISSVAAIWLLSDMMIRSQVSNNLATDLFSKMNKEKLVDISYYTEVAKRVSGFSLTAAGKTVPDINSINTYTGDKFELSSLRGKYVLLDFWGTWCGPCIAGMPKMKEYLDKYNDKMEIVGVASESDKGERWRKFLDGKPQYQWHHVLSTKDEDYILKFSVAGFPTKIIVDSAGKIVGRFVGENDEIYKKLDELLR
ncbi:MAG: thioredoxin-like domain-containing protein [Chitinophagaceae bacterium]